MSTGNTQYHYKRILNRVILKLNCEGAGKSWIFNTLSGGAGYER